MEPLMMPSYWTAGSSWTVSGGVATATSSTSTSYLQKDGILTTENRYVIRITISSYSTTEHYMFIVEQVLLEQNYYQGVFC